MGSMADDEVCPPSSSLGLRNNGCWVRILGYGLSREGPMAGGFSEHLAVAMADRGW